MLGLSRLPLRARLTVWYTLILGFILLAFSAFVYARVRAGLLAQVDAALTLATNQALLGVAESDGRLTFAESGRNPQALRRLSDDFVIFLLSPNGTVLDTLSSDDQLPRFPSQPSGSATVFAEGDPWRVYSQTITIAGHEGRLLAAQELDPVNTTLLSLEGQLLLGLPLALLLAGLGGYYLAGRALRPIDHITRTAQAISAGNLDRRIAHDGPADEVGRLAQTVDGMLDRLEAAFARERRFTADAAHELRTPLTALKGRLGVTLSRARPVTDYRATLIEMEEQVDRLIRLTNDLLFIARLEQAEFRPRLEDVEVTSLFGSLLDQLRLLAAARSVALVEELPPGLQLRGDIDLLIRLFLNLLDNAIKYTPPAGQVTVRGEKDDRYVTIAIHNTGPSIPAEHLPHLFERFYRVEDDRTRVAGSGGAGLGLAIAWEITRFHGGDLTAESAPGRGATFFVRLPARS